MGWGEAIKGLLISLPKLLDAFSRLSKLAAEKSFQDFVTDLDQTTQALENAKTDKERFDAAKRLSDLIRRS